MVQDLSLFITGSHSNHVGDRARQSGRIGHGIRARVSGDTEDQAGFAQGFQGHFDLIPSGFVFRKRFAHCHLGTIVSHDKARVIPSRCHHHDLQLDPFNLLQRRRDPGGRAVADKPSPDGRRSARKRRFLGPANRGSQLHRRSACSGRRRSQRACAGQAGGLGRVRCKGP